VTPERAAAPAGPLGIFDLRGHTAVITGASGAYGRMLSLALAEMGCRLLLASGSEEGLEETAAAARQAGGEVTTIVCRPDDEASAEAIVAAAYDAYEQADLLVVASGYNKPALIGDMPLELWEQVMDANVRGEWLMSKAFGTRLIERGERGKVIMVSSTKGRHGSPAGYTAYSTSKGATDALVRVLATEWGKHGITVNAIAPTVFRSALTSWIFEDTERGAEARSRNLSRLPLGRLGEPEDLLGISIYLLSAASDFCTGQVVYVDGGFTAA
jgi:NAD(P)-dependent dehydrogenase (short-subunit alcohol dehydrogenase family)